jgi:hypothetical protein
MPVNLVLFMPEAIIMKQPGALLGAATGILCRLVSGQLDTLRECIC